MLPAAQRAEPADICSFMHSEVAAIALVLASPEGAGITSGLINVDGGTAAW